MRFACVSRGTILLAGTLFLLYNPTGWSQIRPRTFSPVARSLAPLAGDALACAGQGDWFPEPPRLVARCNMLASAPAVWQDPVGLHLAALGARGRAIEQARERVIAILAAENSCSAWFRESDPDPAGAFQSLDFTLSDGPRDVVVFRSATGDKFFKHPFSADVPENAGHHAIIEVNANGAFFAKVADVLERDPPARFVHFAGRRALRVGSYEGSTLPARITTLLHELGHVVGRLPDDSDELSGLSNLNTERVLQACRAEIKASAHQHPDKRN